MTDFDSYIYRIIAGGTREAPITRTQLMIMSGQKDRMIRKAIQNLNEAGHTIVSLQKGYYIPETKEDVESYKRREMRRAFTILNKVKHLLKNQELIKQLKLSF